MYTITSLSGLKLYVEESIKSFQDQVKLSDNDFEGCFKILKFKHMNLLISPDSSVSGSIEIILDAARSDLSLSKHIFPAVTIDWQWKHIEELCSKRGIKL